MVAVAGLILTGLTYFRVALLPEFGSDLGLSTTALGVLTTVYAVGRLAVDIPSGRLADRFPAASILAFTAAGIALGSLMISLSVTATLLYIASFLLGLCSSTTIATGMTYFSGVSETAHRGTSMAVFSAGLLSGQALGPAAAGLIAATAGWRVAMGVAACIGAMASLALLLMRSRRPVPRRQVAHQAVDPSHKQGIGWSSMVVLQSVSFAVFLATGAVVQTLVPIMGAESLGLGTAAIGLALGLGGITRFVGTLIGGRLSDKMTRKRVLVPALLMQALGVSLLALPPSLPWFLSAIVVMALSSFAIPVAAAIIGDLAGSRRMGAELGRFRFAGDLGFVLGPVSIGIIYENVGPQTAFVAVAALLAVVGLVCLRLLP